MPRPDSDPASQEFHFWFDSNCQPGLRDPAHWDPTSNSEAPLFLPWSALVEYFHSNNYTRLRKLLHVALQGPVTRFVDFDTIANNCLQVFSILLLIGKSEYIGAFAERDHLQDSHLPFDANVADFPKCAHDEHPDEFLRRFRQRQWTLCAPAIGFQINRALHDERILPITIKKRLGRGVSGTLFEVDIHPGYNKLFFSSQGAGTQMPNDRPATNTFVLKIYMGDRAEQSYLREVGAFQKLQYHGPIPGIIRFHGSFKQQGRFNVLLEFADIGTLEHYYRTLNPPTTGEDIINFWDQMFKLIGAVKCIHHEGQLEGDDGGLQYLQGWHQDIKPENILVSSLGKTINSPFEYLMKLADLGTCHFRNPASPNEQDTDQDSQGTNTYGAPECCRTDDFLRSGQLNVTQKVDVWSLGAVFSEAAVWVTSSMPGLKRYRQARYTSPKDPGIQNTDCFHDGQEVLDMVLQTHRALVLKADDVITERVIAMIESMLKPESSRDTILNFWKSSQRIINEAKIELKSKNQHPDGPSILPNHRFAQSPEPWSSLPSTPTSTSIYAAAARERFDSSVQMESVYPRHVNRTFHGTQQVEGQDPASNRIRPSIPLDGNQAVTHHQRFQSGDRQGRFTPKNSEFETQMGARARTFENHSAQQPVPRIAQSMNHQDPRVMNGPGPSSWDWNGTASRGIDPIKSAHTIRDYYEPPHIPQRSTSNNYHSNYPTQERRLFDNSPPHSNLGESHGHGNHQANMQTQTDMQVQGNSSPQQPDYHLVDHLGISSPPPTNPGMQHRPHYQAHDSRMTDGNPHISNSSILQSEHTVPPSFENRSSAPDLPPVVQKRKQAPPADLPIGEAIDCRARKGNLKDLEGYYLQKRLEQRDHVLVVDDVQSMLPHWMYMEKVFGVLAYVIKPADSDGVDLRFTTSAEVINSIRSYAIFGSKNSSKKLLDAVRDRRSKVKKTSNIEWTLEPILSSYTRKLIDAKTINPGTFVRPLNIYILTDGIWEEGEGSDPSATITRAVNRMVELGYSASQIGIQFIVFGNSEEGWKKIQDLDDNLGSQWDIVDSTRANGNMWKMLLGANDKTFDNS